MVENVQCLVDLQAVAADHVVAYGNKMSVLVSLCKLDISERSMCVWLKQDVESTSVALLSSRLLTFRMNKSIKDSMFYQIAYNTKHGYRTFLSKHKKICITLRVSKPTTRGH